MKLIISLILTGVLIISLISALGYSGYITYLIFTKTEKIEGLDLVRCIALWLWVYIFSALTSTTIEHFEKDGEQC
jgi:hypothetical protein